VKLRNSILIIIAVALVFSATKSVNAQQSQSRYNYCIGANPIGLLFGLFNVSFEMKTARANSFAAYLNYWGLSGWNGYGLGASYRWYIDAFKDGKKPIEGFFVGPAISFGFWDYTGSGAQHASDWNGATFAFGGEAGYKWIWDSFYLEPTLGISLTVAKPEHLTNYSVLYGGVTLGYAW
jgi:hypothetical protein